MQRTQDVACSPYRRVLRSGVLSPQAAEDLAAIYEITNPLALRREIRAQLGELFALASRSQ